MQYKSFTTAIIATALTLVSVQAQAGATAMARVTANIVPAVTASVSGSVVLQSMPAQNATVANTQHNSVTLSTASADTPAKFKVRNTGNFDYVVTVSPVVTPVKNSAGDMQLTRYTLPSTRQSAGGDDSQDLTMNASLTTDHNNGKGAYNGAVYITANFN